MATPDETELEGVRLDFFVPGMVHDVSSSLGNWLIAQGYALSEMRNAEVRDVSVNPVKSSAPDRRRHPR